MTLFKIELELATIIVSGGEGVNVLTVVWTTVSRTADWQEWSMVRRTLQRIERESSHSYELRMDLALSNMNGSGTASVNY